MKYTISYIYIVRKIQKHKLPGIYVCIFFNSRKTTYLYPTLTITSTRKVCVDLTQQYCVSSRDISQITTFWCRNYEQCSRLM